jgi:hypothetical protein
VICFMQETFRRNICLHKHHKECSVVHRFYCEYCTFLSFLLCCQIYMLSLELLYCVMVCHTYTDGWYGFTHPLCFQEVETCVLVELSVFFFNLPVTKQFNYNPNNHLFMSTVSAPRHKITLSSSPSSLSSSIHPIHFDFDFSFGG